ncbi:MAG: hypothetical protein A3F46_04445 [Legionellales bacterium RIFCSPHIGHO2_12_FULL_42_9]|nr:MAG: hypothetical protein A3F46_04445 [Legionellales bacterium RIFCSPHIGHO2_12_FULL_42_9]
MRGLIVQNCNGVTAGKTYRSELSTLDEGHSQVYASSLFVRLNEKGEDIAGPKETDDKIVIAYTYSGMVFQIVTDGFYGCERLTVFNFIDTYIVPLMEEYSNELMIKNPDRVTSELIKRIYTLYNKHNHGAEFTLSIAMTYPKEGAIRCAGFGIGDTAIAIKRTNGKIQQLVAHAEVDGFKDAFDVSSASNPELVINRNTMFDVQVEVGDEIVGYTYLPPELETLTREFSIPNSDQSLTTVKHFILNPELVNEESSLFTQLLNVVQTHQQSLIAKAQRSNTPQQFGDDFTVGCIKIPSLALMNQLKLHMMTAWIMENLNRYLSEHNKISGFYRFFMPDPTLRAAIYKNLITHYKNYPLCLEVIFLALLSNQKDEKLFPLINPDSDPKVKRDEIKNEWLLAHKLLYSDLQIRCADQETTRLTTDINAAEQVIIHVTACIDAKKDARVDIALTQILSGLETPKTVQPSLS